jgi:hypothetical protein
MSVGGRKVFGKASVAWRAFPGGCLMIMGAFFGMLARGGQLSTHEYTIREQAVVDAVIFVLYSLAALVTLFAVVIMMYGISGYVVIESDRLIVNRTIPPWFTRRVVMWEDVKEVYSRAGCFQTGEFVEPGEEIVIVTQHGKISIEPSYMGDEKERQELIAVIKGHMPKGVKFTGSAIMFPPVGASGTVAGSGGREEGGK